MEPEPASAGRIADSLQNRLPANAPMSPSVSDLTQKTVTGQAPRTVVYFDHVATLSGGEIALYDLLNKLDRSRYTPVVVLAEDGQLRSLLDDIGVETHVIPLSAQVAKTRKDSLRGNALLRLSVLFTALAYTRRLARFLRERQADLVHTNTMKAAILGGIAARMARKPLLWHIRDRIETDYLPAPAVRICRWLARVLPDVVIANSRATLETIRLPASKITGIVYSGVTLEKMQPTSAHPTDTATEPRVGIVGRLTRWKGQHIFLQAAAIVHQKFPNVRFQIIGAPLFGEEDYEAEIRHLTASLGLHDSVEFTGFRRDIPDLLDQLTILVHASISGEPFGQVVVQGMAAGKPVVATNGGGIPEIVVPGVTGLLVPMGDAEAMAEAILNLLSDPQAARMMGQAGRKRIEEQFTIEISVRTVQELYDRLLAHTGH